MAVTKPASVEKTQDEINNPDKYIIDETTQKKVQVIPVNGKDFHWVETAEPHASRRREILQKYPEMKELFGPEILTLPIVLGIVALQLFMANFVNDKPWYVLLFCAYWIGGTVNHSLQLAAHELSHNLCFGVPALDKALGIVANMPTGLPSAITFIKYHMEHHLYQGSDTMDVDIPSRYELEIFQGPFMKFIWCVLQPFFYSIRPLLIKPKTPGIWEFANIVVAFTFDFFVYQYIGGWGLAYLILGTFLGLGFHPLAGHFIAEHYVLTPGQETYSYYGMLNWFMFNVGYHNEHHDFPRIAWSNLRKVRKIAPEYYDNLPSYDSYWPVFYEYIFNPEIGPWSRVLRKQSVAAQNLTGKKNNKLKTG